MPKKDRCWKNKHIVEVNNHTVNLDDMQGIFFVLLLGNIMFGITLKCLTSFLGFMFALLLLIFEKIWSSQFGRNKEKIIHPFVS